MRTATSGTSAPILLLTTTGRKSGKQYTTPLIFGEDNGRYLIVGSRGGAETHAQWFLNLRKNPEVGLQIKGDKFQARARIADDNEKPALWQVMTKIWPDYDDYQQRTQRVIPVVILERVQEAMKLTLLGTGSPAPNVQRRGPGQIIEAGDDLILVDCGAGTLHRLVEAGYATRALNAIAFTHLHSDHVTGILDVLWAGWIQRRWTDSAGRLRAARHAALHRPPHGGDGLRHPRPPRAGAQAREPGADGRGGGGGLERRGRRLAYVGLPGRAHACRPGIRLPHRPGRRFDRHLGDTKECENLVRHSQDASILVHEVFWSKGLQQIADAATEPEERARFELLRTYHTGSIELGRVARDANTKHLVLSHLLRAQGDPTSFAEDIEPSFGGKMTVGEDLMTFEV